MNQSSPGAAPTRPAPAEAGLHARVLDHLGTAICSGDVAAGSVLSIEDLVDRYQVSRSVIREVLRVLASMGLVETRRRVGIMIQPPGMWSVFDPQVIRWRLASEGRMAQLRSITELRTAIEPHAAWLAAERVDDDEASELVGLAARMWAAGKAGDEARFLDLDIDFHRRVLAASGNEMFAKLQLIVAEVLAGRHHYHLMPHYPDEEALRLHTDVAQAIQRRDGERARRAMVGIMEQGFAEMKSLWERTAEPGGA
ncbi:FadR/GntR family transcriptional regulator [Nonomuraea angiospora]|uniref:DNA-binding FadR family transcriptional regulator n=1 Tax=Nonomuraea angiospora TaxID=46172 RepID=A0ABR9LRW8_9ACTN|nr:FCD domain-containing protein [Nonomuraea angiospora]MBE1583415.1 DNA-binding FadR family transcriptional regulator [Nonomuraea angiospora]